MEIANDELQVRFTVPDHPTRRQVLAYDSVRDLGRGLPVYERLWDAARAIIEPGSWECDAIQPADDLDQASDTRAIEIIKWVGLTVMGWRKGLDELPKNS